MAKLGLGSGQEVSRRAEDSNELVLDESRSRRRSHCRMASFGLADHKDLILALENGA